MPPIRTYSLLALVSASLFAVSLSSAQMSESAPLPAGRPIAIRVSRPQTPQEIAPTLFSSFLEPIGHSTYGGLWADVVVNPSFEEGLWSAENLEEQWNADPDLRAASSLGLPTPWKPLDFAEGSRYAPIRGDAANSAQSMLLMPLPEKEVGIREQVYLPAARELQYHGSIWLKRIDGPAQVRLSLRRSSRPAEVLAETVLTASSAGWNPYEFHLALKPDTLASLEPADFAISLEGNSRVLIDNVSLFPDDAVDGMDPEVIALARALHSPLVRFGGNFTSAYDWHDGVGPADKRVSMLNLAWGIPEYNTFGTDEFLRFCALIHAQPQIALNLGTGRTDQAAAWVRYVNAHWGDGKGGLTWELGNELWGSYQVGYPAPAQAARLTAANSEAVHGVDPAAHLIATGGDGGLFHDWNAQMLTDDAKDFEYLSSHFIVNEGVLLPNASDDFRTMAMLAVPWGLSGRIDAMRQQAVAAHRPDLKFAFTEWLMITDSHTVPNYSNLGGAIFAGGFLNTMMRHADTVSIADMTGILEFGGIWKKRGQVYPSPAYWVLRSYAQAGPHFLLRVQDDSPTYSIAKGLVQLPDVAHAPYLDVVAALSEDQSKLILFCVNRSLTRPEQATLDLSAIGEASGMAGITTIQGNGILDENNAYAPDRISGVKHTEAIRSGGTYTFPNASITVMEIPMHAH
ncbi:alpha-L-arabinofuranosidase C-terminal domain-containing protein [Silvibacterium dinghuense]|uniref:alpha-L-arabinofuranosidase C-terminal domain-containing protein n=1 Tax=Silvibacterium dinghuense TaxID=1560006 RepID=UPI0013E97113|nr:alpha-L-arabinofuranosidase C-terminal domain-containing protein [Silvibacterium dinghuense]GGH08184.1 hypothetical protein GCM10011586_25590 [Silvibacterium dinghuense]